MNPLKEFRNGYRKSSTAMWALTEVRKNGLDPSCTENPNSPYYYGGIPSFFAGAGMYAGLAARALRHLSTASKNAEYIFGDRRED